MASNMPDFRRAEYVEPPTVLEGTIEPQVPEGAFVKSLLFGAVAAAAGSVGYALIGFSGFMVSIVAIGLGWLVAKAMMTGSGGVGGRSYQIAATVLTYLSVTTGDLLDVLHYNSIPLTAIIHLPARLLMTELMVGPFLALKHPFNGAIGLVILFVGLRAAWQIAAGGSGAGRRMTPFGMR